MVAMGMGNEYLPKLHPAQTGASPLFLGAFTAVEHQQLLTEVHHLRRRLVPGCRQGRTASEDMYVESLHLLQQFLQLLAESTTA